MQNKEMLGGITNTGQKAGSVPTVPPKHFLELSFTGFWLPESKCEVPFEVPLSMSDILVGLTHMAQPSGGAAGVQEIEGT